MKTLQEQYNLIKEGKGNKEILLKTAKQLYPNVIPNHFTYNQAVPLLKQRGLLHESIGGVVTKGTDPDWFAIFKENINEAKAIEKKPTKEVVDMETRGYDYKNKENIDNVYGQAFLIGYYAEMKDPANANKTVDDLKAIVAKNLYKDPLYYVKNGQFGVKGVGYTDEAPGLTASKTDQMTPVPDQVKPKASKTDLGDREKKTGAAKKVKGEMTVTPKSSKGVKKMPLPGKEKKIRLQEIMSPSQLAKYTNMSDQEIMNWAKQDGMEELIIPDEEGGLANREELLTALLGFETDNYPMGDYDDDDMINPAGSEDYLQEQKIRSIISQLIREELEEVTYQMGTNLGSFSGGNKGGGEGDGEGGNRKIPRVLFLPKSAIESINSLKPGSIRLVSRDKEVYMYVSDMFVNAMNELERGRTSYEKESKKSELARLISDKIPSAVRSKIKKETNPKKDMGLNMHYVNLILANNKDRTGYWILLKKEFDPLMREAWEGAEFDTGKFDDGPQPPDDMNPEMMWNSLPPDMQEELLMSYIKDPDEAIFFVGKEWDSIPDDVTANILNDDRFFGEIDLDEITASVTTSDPKKAEELSKKGVPTKLVSPEAIKQTP